ncbi:hypothetical protein D9M73_116640 [compost metagenome]
MFSVAPSSRWHSTSAGFITSMSPETAMSPALTGPGPVAESWRRFGPSPCMRSAICFTFSTMSVTSSRTPASEENSCRTFSILIEVTAAPCSEDSSTRRSALPSVRPKPRSSGSAMKVALRLPSPPGFFSRPDGFFNSCQFFALTDIGYPLVLGRNGAIPAIYESNRAARSTAHGRDEVRRDDAWTGERRCAGSRSRHGSK